jgi:hypothetical protein
MVGFHTYIVRNLVYDVFMKKLTHTSIRYTPEARQLLDLMAKKLGVSQTAIVEMAIREFAEKRGFYDPHADHPLPSAQN